MKFIHSQYARSHGLYQPGPLTEAAQQANASAVASPYDADELVIDIDREIWCLEQLSGVADASHSPAQTRAFVAWIATICADAADRGGGRVELGKAAAVGARHYTRPWRNLACLLARRCAALSRRYGAEEASALPGEVIRWLFCDTGTLDSRGLH